LRDLPNRWSAIRPLRDFRTGVWKTKSTRLERKFFSCGASARFGGEVVAGDYAVMGFDEFPPECGGFAIFAAELRP
jgi:hypothetical protein